MKRGVLAGVLMVLWPGFAWAIAEAWLDVPIAPLLVNIESLVVNTIVPSVVILAWFWIGLTVLCGLQRLGPFLSRVVFGLTIFAAGAKGISRLFGGKLVTSLIG